MKRLMIAGLMMAAATAFGGMKIGTVDMMLLVRNHPSYETNKKYLQDTEKDYQKELEAMKAEAESLQAEGLKRADELKNPMLAEAAKQKAEKELMDIQQRFVRKQQDLRNAAMKKQQQLGEAEAKLLKAQAEDLKTRIGKFADKEGYDLIVDSAAAIFASKGLDVTDEILKAMNVDPKEARAKEKNEGK